MSETNMNCALSLEGSLCGCETTFCGGYGNQGMQYSAKIVVTKKSLEELIGILGTVCKQKTSPFIRLLDDFKVVSTFSHNPYETVIAIESDSIKFLGLDTRQGKMIAFSMSFGELSESDSNTLNRMVHGMITCFGVKNYKFLYRSTDLTSSELYKKYSILSQIPGNIRGNIILNAEFDFDNIATSNFTRAMSELFGVHKMNVYLCTSGNEFEGVLTIPDIDNDLLKCRNIMLYANFSTSGAKFTMQGSIALKCLEALEFALNCDITMTSVSISASTMPTNVYRIPGTPISICNSGLEIGVSGKGISFSVMTQLNITNLMWFGALSISYQGEAATLDMLSAAMSEVSLSSLVENLTGLTNQSIEALDEVAVKSFDLEGNGKTRKIHFADMTDSEIIAQVNQTLQGMKSEFLLTEGYASITRMPGNNACDVLNTKTMFHYWIDGDGNLSFPPQAYYAAKRVTIGKYNFEEGIFFCGKLILFGFDIKVMFSAVYGQGVMGFAQIKEIETRVLKISGSESSRKMPNLVLGSATNSTLSLLTSSFTSDEVISNPAVLYVNVSKNSCNFYVDAHFELCNVFAFDTLMYYMNKRIHIAAETTYFNMIKASILLDVDYSLITNAAFKFELALDCTGLHNKLTELSRLVEDAAKKYSDKVSNAQQQIQDAKKKVSSLQKEIDANIKKINDCKNKIKNTRKVKRWIVAISEGIKISAYEVAIVGIKVAMKTAQAALDIANKVLEISGKVGDKVLNAISSVIKGVLEAFYINKALLNIIVNGNTMLVDAEIDVTVLGKQFDVEFTADLDELMNKPVEMLEDRIINSIRSFIDQLKSGEYILEQKYECLEYSYMDEEEDVLKAADMVAYGTKRINQAADMITDLQQLWVDEMHQMEPDFEELDTEYKDAVEFLAYSMEQSAQNLYADGMDDIISELQIALEENRIDESKIKDARECIEQYVNEVRPANTMITETSQRLTESVGEIDTTKMKTYFRKTKNEAEDYTGVDIIENRDYAKFYNEVEAIIEKYYPEDSGEGYFNFTDEENFYEMLNEAREEAGCACAQGNNITEEENSELKQYFTGWHTKKKNGNYRQRLL